ncbi:hypothetical protein N7462_002327 [Penicillium macrosclerotiorum]|uniref:uncharacterized protein n=1 Tax=Penicillium macrosclerotiorum TaxID=303699 RepID=UPI0025496B02|nr:uncharacterized protein N7462_002327 [Penicillium macrosclerotiorum]KAJ5692904.1 hypothetical protein N7462_002327 [Penicillium macrosclerotiorum]
MTSSRVDRASVQPHCDELFRKIESKFHSSNIPTDKWYLTALSALTATSEPQLADQLYLYLVSQPAYTTASARMVLIRRLREVIIKDIALLGIPKPAEAIIAISRVEPENEMDTSFSREGWQCDHKNHERGMSWLQKIYAQNTEALFDLFKRHRDFGFIVSEVAYGLHLSDRQELGDIETELVVLPAVMAQNLPRMTYWHVRGTRRLGVSKEDVQMVCECVREVARFCGYELDRVPVVETVEDEL